MTRVKIHPLFFILVIVLVWLGKWVIISSTIFAVIIHEYAHYVVAKSKGYRLTNLTLMPYGAVISSSEYILSDDEALIAAAGPFCNLFVAIIIMALWWLYPSCYGYTLELFRANLAIAGFNVLPAYPLDGARIILSMSKNRKKATKLLQIIGIVLSILLIILFVLMTVFFEINYTLGIASIFIFLGSMSISKKENYVHLCNQLSYLKDYNHPLEKKHIVINSNVSIKKIIKVLKPYTIVKLEVVDNAMNTVAIVNECQMEEIFLTTNANATILQALEKLNGRQ